jgi:hypothetical protein
MHTLLSLGTFVFMASTALADDLPKRELTPGATRPDVTVTDICTPGYGKNVRNVSSSLKSRVYELYGVTGDLSGVCSGNEGCELDHLIPLGLGGSNDLANLWPQSYDTHPWNAHVKDKLENYLHDAVCSEKMTLGAAQRAISEDWIEAYKKYLGELR